MGGIESSLGVNALGGALGGGLGGALGGDLGGGLPLEGGFGSGEPLMGLDYDYPSNSNSAYKSGLPPTDYSAAMGDGASSVSEILA